MSPGYQASLPSGSTRRATLRAALRMRGLSLVELLIGIAIDW
jgi:Tfp pilus assembly protein FimT